jgi:hypothetical protein
MTFRIRLYPHNDLSNLAYYHREVVNAKIASGNLEGIALDCMSFFIALAFSVEAFVNFVGSKKIKNWNERAPYPRKMEALSEKFKMPFSQSHEPYATLARLKAIRDQMAHGKPREFISPASSKAELSQAMSPMWSGHIASDCVNSPYEQVEKFKAMLLKAAHINLGGTLTSGVGGGT